MNRSTDKGREMQELGHLQLQFFYRNRASALDGRIIAAFDTYNSTVFSTGATVWIW